MEKKIHQYLDGKLPEKEQRNLLEWIRNEDNQQTFNSVKEGWWKNNNINSDQGITDFGRIRLHKRINEKLQLQHTKRYLKLYKYTAVILLVLSLSSSIFLYQNYFNVELQTTEIHTDFGQISSMTLPDGTRVWINSGTKLSFNNQYGINNRDIKVNGEAFFSVTKDKLNPFVVDMGAIKVEVTGTQFGVSNYNDLDKMNVVLEEGSVNIHSANNKLLTRLKPDELAYFSKKGKTIEKISVNPENYTSWKDGLINIFELPLEQLVLKLEKRFNQKFEVDPPVKDFPYTFSIEGESLAEILHLIERISPVKAVQEGNVIKLKYMNH